MGDEVKDAMAWLEKRLQIATDTPYMSLRMAESIKRLLARPVMPEEPSPEAMRAMADVWMNTDGKNCWQAIYRALYAHMTKPATKTVEVWHVEYAHYNVPNVVVRQSAEGAEQTRANIVKDGCTCVRVTGPHQQEVPA